MGAGTGRTVGFTHLSSGTAPILNFSGHVHRQRDNGGIANATVQLFVSSLDGTSLVDSDETAADGAFSLSYRGYGPGLFIIQEEDPVGMYSISADGGADGTVINANVIGLPGSGRESCVLSCATFSPRPSPFTRPSRPATTRRSCRPSTRLMCS